jgi:hypothetical protein
MLVSSAEEKFSPSNLPIARKPFNGRVNGQGICPFLMQDLKEIDCRKKLNFI